jgi:hypothetical protein
MLIGIAGAKRSGKTTLACALSERFGLRHLSFAAPIRGFVCELLGWTEDELEQRKELPVAWLDGVTPRHMMQTLGTEWGRSHVHSELWIRHLARQVDDAGGRAVVSDLRFPNEAESIIARGGIVVRLHRGRASGDSHVSELSLPDRLVHIEFDNAGTIAEMVEHIVRGVESTLLGRVPAALAVDED